MSRLLVTGADGFVGRWLVREALRREHDVVAVTGPGGAPPAAWLAPDAARQVATFEADMTRPEDRARIAATEVDAIVHLAAVASGAQARRDPEAAMALNAEATALLLGEFEDQSHRPRFLFVSTGEVYGAGHDGPIPESAPARPVSPYAASKLAAEAAVLGTGNMDGMEALVARPFPHTGPGQDTRFVLPAFAKRLRDAKRTGEGTFAVGNLDVVRDFLDVRDVVRAYLLLLERGEPGGVYNVATGQGQHLEDCIRRLAAIIGVEATPVQDPALVRPADIPVLLGDPTRLIAATGWSPQYSFDRTLQDLVDAQAD
ncbi:MAG TPA: GDP-mannose 4,6-dehydratase [Gemmatimonadales bacterium]|nr:GDP-mannose 4,6-dehydratase [Gemmatimonadales bacterium]HRX18460.1 GDP-mannose 4,6-dehydratase [Gemmatimonadales bacterium]